MKERSTWESFFSSAGALSVFTGRFAVQATRGGQELRELGRQCFVIGYQSLPLTALTGFIMGLVLTIQLRPSLLDYGVESQLPSMISVAVIRELGPVITALIFAGKIGSRIGAELGSMRVTEQIDAMEVSGTNPFKFLVVTRVLACTLMLPALALIADAIALYGSYLGVNIKGNTSFPLFYRQAMNILSFGDVVPAFLKTFLFGFAVGIIGCFEGYFSKKGTEGVGRSANSAVVTASIAVFIIDLISVLVTDLLNLN
ncbi:MAG: ABC transporter permease [Chitinophagaceae bacterium]|nr:MAG: ABC transporter permease [Chitinophagaceae bacterium]